MKSAPPIEAEVQRLLSDSVIREKAETHFRGHKLDCRILAAGCRHAATTLLEYRSDARIRLEIEKLYNLCNNAMVSESLDARARSIADYFDGMSNASKLLLLNRRSGREIISSLCLRSYQIQEQRRSIEQLRSLTMIGGCMVQDRKRPGRPAGRERSNKFNPILNAPTTKRGQQPPEAIREFVMWMQVAYLDAFGEPPSVRADNWTPGRFIDFMNDILEVLGERKADLVRATNYLASLRSQTEIRDETPADREDVRSVNEAAFGRPGEADLVDNLRNDGDVMLSLVAVEGERIVGHVLFSRMDAPFAAWSLGPVAVSPDQQQTGIGSRLIRAGLDRVREAGIEGVFVLGAPNYYTRFGFDLVLASGFTSPYAGPYLMVLAVDGTLPANTGRVEYAPAFARLC